VYLDHFGLNEPPFSITPDTGFIVGTRSHQEALNTVLVALSCGEGFIKITGEVGTGKTLLCRRLLQVLPEHHVSAYLPNPQLSPRHLLRALAKELSLKVATRADDYQLMQKINNALLEHSAAGRQVVVCIDETQAMPLETLESLRLLSNLETEKRKLLQIVIFGQPELDERLAEPTVRQLRQRIAFHHRLVGLDRAEVAHYLEQRLHKAGYRGASVFGGLSVRCLHRASRGTPRLINILAHKALLAVYGEGRHVVGVRHARAAAKDTEGTAAPGWL